jgi:hypothetical protein
LIAECHRFFLIVPADERIELKASGQVGTGASDWAKYQKEIGEANRSWEAGEI